jgi:hypothetical protein
MDEGFRYYEKWLLDIMQIYLWLYCPCGPWPLLQFLNLYTVSRTPWTRDQPVASPLPTHRINTHKHLCFRASEDFAAPLIDKFMQISPIIFTNNAVFYNSKQIVCVQAFYTAVTMQRQSSICINL